MAAVLSLLEACRLICVHSAFTTYIFESLGLLQLLEPSIGAKQQDCAAHQQIINVYAQQSMHTALAVPADAEAVRCRLVREGYTRVTTCYHPSGGFYSVQQSAAALTQVCFE
jgi:hypothetical protein